MLGIRQTSGNFNRSWTRIEARSKSLKRNRGPGLYSDKYGNCPCILTEYWYSIVLLGGTGLLGGPGHVRILLENEEEDLGNSNCRVPSL